MFGFRGMHFIAGNFYHTRSKECIALFWNKMSMKVADMYGFKLTSSAIIFLRFSGDVIVDCLHSEKPNT